MEVCLRAQCKKLYHMGFWAVVSRNTLSNANLQRDWCIWQDLALGLIATARTLYAGQDFFVTRAKSNTQTRRVGSREVDKAAGLVCDQGVVRTVADSRRDYPERLRRIVYVAQASATST